MRDRAFVLFAVGRLVSALGTSITLVVLPVLAYSLTGSATILGIVMATEALPYLIFGLPAAAVADRSDRRRIMVAADVASAAVIATIPLAALVASLSVVHLVVVALAIATLFVWFDAAAFGALPALIPRERLASANGLLYVGYSTATIIGPAIAGIAIATVGATTTLAIDALSYLISAVTLLAIARPFRTTERPRSGRIRADIAEGLAFVRRHRLVRTLTSVGAGVSFVDGALKALVVVLAVRTLGVGPTDPFIGAAFAAIAVGAVTGGLAAIALQRWLADTHVSLVGLVVTPLAIVLLAISSEPWLVLAAYLTYEVAHSIVVINGLTIRQRVTPDALQGRVNVTGRMIAWGGTPFGALFGGVLADLVPVTTVLLVAATILAVVVASSARVLIRIATPLETGGPGIATPSS